MFRFSRRPLGSRPADFRPGHDGGANADDRWPADMYRDRAAGLVDGWLKKLRVDHGCWRHDQDGQIGARKGVLKQIIEVFPLSRSDERQQIGIPRAGHR